MDIAEILRHILIVLIAAKLAARSATSAASLSLIHI